SAGTPFRFDYTGGTQTLETPAVTTVIQFTVYGAAGGRGYNTFTSPTCGSGSETGGYGGMAEGQATFAAGTLLYVEVGGQGDDGGCADRGPYDTRSGGYNGGGRGSQGGSGGGGGTDVRTTSGDLSSRLIVGGGGGGCGYESGLYRGGHGGGLTGETSGSGSSGGSQTSGGSGSSSSGAFGVGDDNVQGNDEGGGGGGWYGGAAGGGANAAGGGGSSYYGGMTSHQSTAAGVNSGDGYVEYIFQ
ncbi:MAG: glycine-rich protein, partial [Myxococcota bacterium]|nr:glycine-rich protein [Myxococcota bacterium]